jgi:hypothetical protein
MRNRLFAIAALLLAAQASAQDTGVRWSLSTGPTLTLARTSQWVCANEFCGPYSLSSGARVITGAEHGKYNATLGVSKMWPGTSLTFRGDVHYSRSESPLHHRWPLFFSDTSMPVVTRQNAPRDETFAATLGLEWHAFPNRAVSPYLSTSFGLALNRLSWNSDTSSKRIDAQHDALGPVTALGAGVRARVGSHELFVEWRSYSSLFDMTGSKIVPFSVGLRF